MSKGNYFAQYESPNIVLVPSLGSSNDGSPTSDKCHAFTTCNKPYCDISAAPATMEYTPTPHSSNENDLNYYDTVPNNYNVNHTNIANTTEENDLKVTWLPRFSQLRSVEHTERDSLVYTQPNHQDYSWANTYPGQRNEYASSTNTIKINLKEKNVKIVQETIHDVNVYPQKNEDTLYVTNVTNNEKNDETCLKSDEDVAESSAIPNVNLPDNLKNNTPKENTNRTSTQRKKLVYKDNAKNNTKTKNCITSRVKCKVTKPKKDLKYLWKRHCAKLKNIIKQDIEGSKDIKTQLHTQWRAILRSEYNTFVKNFYRSALISKNKIKSVIANNKMKLKNQSKTNLKSKQPVLNSSSNAVFTQINKDDRIKCPNSLRSQAPNRACLRNQYEDVDLRTILCHKRNQNLCYKPQKYMAKRPRDRENLIITVNQDIQADTQKPKAVEPKPKKKCKKIQLVINVVSKNSEAEEDSEHSDDDHCSLFNEDLSFLDDFNIDDIVDSLNSNNLLEGDKAIQKLCTDKITSINVCKDGVNDGDLNGPCLSISEEMDMTEPQLASENENHTINSSLSTIIIGNATNDVTANSPDPRNNFVQNITASTLASLDVETEINDFDQRFLDETKDTTKKAELYRETNNIKNELKANIDEKQHNILGTLENEWADHSITNKTSVNIMKLNGTNIKTENVNMEAIHEYITSSEAHTTVPNIIDMNTEIKPESNNESTTVQIVVAKHTKEMNDEERKDLVEIEIQDEPIIISDNEGNDQSVTNIKAVIIENVNINSDNDNTNLSEDNTIISEAYKKENSNENAQQVNKELVSLDEIGDCKGNMNIQDHNMHNPAIAKTNVVPAKSVELAKQPVNSTDEDIKTSVSHEKHEVSIVSNKIPKFKAGPKNKQIRKKYMDQGLVDKLQKRMLDFLDNPYNITSIIHGGNFSKIYKCTNSKGDNFALKVLHYVSNHQILGLRKEKMLMRLQKYVPRDQLNIVYILNSFGMAGYWCFIMEYYPKNLEQALFESKKGFHINLVQALARQLVAAVSVLTNNNIVHTDIKPKHILLNSTNDKLKLCGFDDSNYIQYLEMKPNTGTVNYRAPEIILGFIADYRIDVWSTALVIFEMATGIQVFPGMYNNDILFKQICTLGEIPTDMREASAYKHYHFINGNFIRIMDSYHRTQTFPFITQNNRLYRALLKSYRQDWQSFATKQEVFEDKAKLNGLHHLLEQMLVMDPRYRLPINFVGISEFLRNDFR